VELAGIGPAPFAGMMLADAGAEVIRVDRIPAGGRTPPDPSLDLLNRGRRSIALDLKAKAGVEILLGLVDSAHGLIEGYRPGVAERLGIGPEVCHRRHPGLVYGRMTGWGQEGPMAPRAGHDIDFIALAGALDPIGRAGGPPVPPLNLVADFGGGGMMLAFGMVSAILHARVSGSGQVVDAAMVDGASLLMTMTHSLIAMGVWSGGRGENVLDSGAPYYEVYETSDHKYMAVGAVEPEFYRALVEQLGLDDPAPDQADVTAWAQTKQRFAEVFRQRTRDEWADIFSSVDACAAPVLTPLEAPEHPHARARNAFVTLDGVRQPAPAPRFSATPGRVRHPPPEPGRDTDELLHERGFSPKNIADLRLDGVVG
jgi:alpha-methylacyl-CoA racemase